MLRVIDIDGFDYYISFKHERDWGKLNQVVEGHLEPIAIGMTTCWIRKLEKEGLKLRDQPTIATATVRCSAKDKFNKQIGRELSFIRALKSIGIVDDNGYALNMLAYQLKKEYYHMEKWQESIKMIRKNNKVAHAENQVT